MAAIREFLTARPGTPPTGSDRVGGRWPVAAGILVVLALAVALRLVPVIFVPSLNWGDEVFQTVEPAHRLVYGYGLMTWEYQVGMRSWLLPGALAGLIELSRIAGEGPEYYLPALALGLGLLGCAPVLCAFVWSRRAFGLAGGFVAAAAVALAPELVYFGARALNDTVAAHLLVAGLYLLAPGDPVEGRKRLAAAGFVLGLVCLLRLQLAPAVAIAVLWPLPGTLRRRLPALIGGGAAAVLGGAALDWATLGYPLASVWRNLFFNIHLGVSSGFSVEPWYFYPLGEVGVWLAGAPLVLLLACLGARRLPMLFAVALAIVAVHSLIPHKEFRFIYPAVVLGTVLAGLGLAELAGKAAAWLAGRGTGPRTATAAGAAAAVALWALLSLVAWSGGALAGLRQRAHDELTAISFVRGMAPPCGVALYGEEAWVRYGGYSHLHRPIAMYWPKDAAALAAAAPGFDTLLYDRSEPPTAALGYAPLRCFGEICVGRRPGRCEPSPLPQAWFPEQLRGTSWQRQRLEAVPPGIRQ